MSLTYSPDRADTIDVNYVGGAITVGTSEILAAVSGSNLSKRQELLIYNKSSNIIYFGPSGVTTTTGIPIGPSEILNLPFTENANVYLIAATAGNSVIIQELA